MEKPMIYANIREGNDGPFYEVRLHFVPRVGETVELTSFANVESGHASEQFKKYTVKAVRHMIYDITEKWPDGMHEVEIVV